jgi:hypothetical protein
MHGKTKIFVSSVFFRVQNNLCDSASLRSKNKFSGTNFLAIVANFLESSQAPQGAF